MIKINKQEKEFISKRFPKVHITVVNKEHVSRDKTYYMEPDRKAMQAIANYNVEAKQELRWQKR